MWTFHNFPELKKVQLAALEFQNFAMLWWDNIVKERRFNGEKPVYTWIEMKALMRARFIPAHHSRELLQRLENLRQGSMSVEDNKTCARYIRVLNSNIYMKVDMYPYS